MDQDSRWIEFTSSEQKQIKGYVVGSSSKSGFVVVEVPEETGFKHLTLSISRLYECPTHQFLSKMCCYAQSFPGFDPANDDSDSVLEMVSYIVSCHLAGATVEGNNGVEADVVYHELETPRTELQWLLFFSKLAQRYGGWFSNES